MDAHLLDLLPALALDPLLLGCEVFVGVVLVLDSLVGFREPRARELNACRLCPDGGELGFLASVLLEELAGAGPFCACDILLVPVRSLCRPRCLRALMAGSGLCLVQA